VTLMSPWSTIRPACHAVFGRRRQGEAAAVGVDVTAASALTVACTPRQPTSGTRRPNVRAPCPRGQVRSPRGPRRRATRRRSARRRAQMNSCLRMPTRLLHLRRLRCHCRILGVASRERRQEHSRWADRVSGVYTDVVLETGFSLHPRKPERRVHGMNRAAELLLTIGQLSS